MSVASSASSMISVSYQGREMTLEECLDECCRGIQGKLNELQVALRNLAQIRKEKEQKKEAEAKRKAELKAIKE